jgi:cbb3-type cytochrome oxidase maturation protein
MVAAAVRPGEAKIMLESTIALIILSLGLGLAAWLAFVWAVKKGEFDDPEGPKYRMMNDDDDDRENGSRRD